MRKEEWANLAFCHRKNQVFNPSLFVLCGSLPWHERCLRKSNEETASPDTGKREGAPRLPRGRIIPILYRRLSRHRSDSRRTTQKTRPDVHARVRLLPSRAPLRHDRSQSTLRCSIFLACIDNKGERFALPHAAAFLVESALPERSGLFPRCWPRERL